MYLNDFSVRIPEGVEEPGGYIALDHNTPYRLVLGNKRDARCDARVEIDGKHVGTWRLAAHSSVTLERPEHDTGRFTFYKLGTEEADRAGLQNGDTDAGLVTVAFTPESSQHFWYCASYSANWRMCSWCGVWYQAFQGHSCATPWRLCNGDNTSAITATSGNASCSNTALNAVSVTADSPAAGGTGLSGQSEQEYSQVGAMSLDYSQRTTIHLRLVCGRSPKALGPRPLTCTSNPVPPPVC